MAGGVATLVLILALGGVAWQSGMFARSPDVIFPRLAREYQQSVFLVESGITVGGNYAVLGTGTAFAAADGGLLLTNKHVVLPHRYGEEAACFEEYFRALGMSFVDSLEVTVWPGGAVFRQSSERYGDRGLGYSTTTGSLDVVELASDNASEEVIIPCNVQDQQFRIRWRPHDQDNADLAVLRIRGNPRPFPLATVAPLEDEPVMAFGFPVGYGVLESTTADPVWRAGRVIRTQETIHTDAVVQGGNSGGPLVNARGEVVGITTRGYNGQFNMALKIDYARVLLERAN